MQFSFTDEQEQLRDIARKFLGRHATSKHVREAADTERGWDPDVWARVGGEVGWTALAIPESCGGFGFGMVEVVAVAEEMGRTLLPSPYLSSIGLAANAVLAGGTPEQQAALLPGLAAAEQTAALAFMPKGGDWSVDGVTARYQTSDAGYTLDGAYHYVLDGHTADWLVVAARENDGPVALFAVNTDAAGVTCHYTPTMDITRRVAEVTLVGVGLAADAMLGTPDSGADALATALDLGRIVLAAEQVGVAQSCLDMAVEYAKVRRQFGKPIGSFQAIKHICADMMVAVESARSAAYWAGWAASNAPDELHEAALTAGAFASEACFMCAAENVQIHGGIGFTWEHDAHLYFKRAKAAEELLGPPHVLRDDYARDVLGLGA